MWIARDGDPKSGDNDGDLSIYNGKPLFDDRVDEFYCTDSVDDKRLPCWFALEVLNGTCYPLVLGEEVKDG